MEKRVYNLRPLPGGRRGAPGADAGCLSMRTIGDEELIRRTPVEEYTTAEHSSHTPSSNSPYPSSPSSPFYQPSPSSSSSASSFHPVDNVVQMVEKADIPAPVTTGPRTRKKWSIEMNIFIVRTYFILTSLETANLRTYLTPLHAKFIKQFPHMKVSKQRVGDQRRAIMRKELLSVHKIKEIKDEVKLMLQNHNNLQAVDSQEAAIERRKWSDDINESIMRHYYRITKLEKNITGYRPQLHKQVTQQFPSLANVSVQRIADQRRVIIHNKLIKPERLAELRSEVMESISDENLMDNISKSISPLLIDDDSNSQLTFNPTVENTNETERISSLITGTQNMVTNDMAQQRYIKYQLTEEEKTNISSTFSKIYIDFSNTCPIQRPYIPKQKSNKKFIATIDYINLVVLPKYLTSECEFQILHTLIYCAAMTAAILNGSKISHNQNRNIAPQRIPKWQKRLQDRIEELRIKIGRLTDYIQGNRSQTLQNHINKIKQNHKIHAQHEAENSTLIEFLDTLKQKLMALANRLRRYKQTTLRKSQNKMFNGNEKLFYRNLTRTPNNNIENNTVELPSNEELHVFWSSIWSTPVEHNQAEWIEEQKQYLDKQTTEMQFEAVSIELLQSVILKTHNWKATGTDKIHNFWYKKLTCVHKHLLFHINNFIKSPTTLPSFVTQGITYMLPKDSTDKKDPAKYRPITCLQTIYKIISSCITDLVYKHIDSNNVLTEQQKGCRRLSQGCKEQLVIDSVISQYALKNKTDIYTMYIDYQKAFDSIPHTWLIYVLQIHKVHPYIIDFLRITMESWATQLKITNFGQTVETEPIQIRRGIFQGDSFSPLWFCLALNPLSLILNNSEKGYKIALNNVQHTISHLMYMDDIKLYASSLSNLNKLADMTQMFSTDIQMKFGIDKCKLQSIRRGHMEKNNYQLNSGEYIDPIDDINGYKYLGYQQSKRIHHKQIKIDINNKFKGRLQKVLNTNLNAYNTTKAINTFVIPILTYSFGIIKWSQTDLQKQQRVINTSMTKYRKHHPRSCVQRLTLPKYEGGRGIIDIKNLHNKQIHLLRSFFHTRAQQVSLHRLITELDNKLTPLNLRNHSTQPNETIIQPQQKLEAWLAKSLHGRHRRDLLSPIVDKTASNAWLSIGELFPETEGFMLAIQDQIIETRNYKKHIIHDTQIDLCRHCHCASETIQHITGACKSITQTDYKHRHDQVACIIHQYLAKKLNLITETLPYYKYKPQAVIDSKEFKLYWDRTIITDRTIHHNRPDITLHDKKHKTVYLIDVGIPNTHNLSATHSDKITKYIDLSIELKAQWQVNIVKTIPIILSTTGVIPITLHSSLQQLNIHPFLYRQLQKAVILNTCRIVRKFLTIQ